MFLAKFLARAFVARGSIAREVDGDRPELAKSTGGVTLLACTLITNLVSPSITCNQGFDLGLRCATESLPKRCFERLIIQLRALLGVSKAKPIEAVWVARRTTLGRFWT